MKEPKNKLQRLIYLINQHDDLTMGERNAALIMAVICGNGRVRVGPGYIAQLLGTSYSSAKKILSRLRDKGYIGSVGQGGGRGLRATRWITPKLVRNDILSFLDKKRGMDDTNGVAECTGEKKRGTEAHKRGTDCTETGNGMSETGNGMNDKWGTAQTPDLQGLTTSGRSDRPAGELNANATPQPVCRPDNIQKSNFECTAEVWDTIVQPQLEKWHGRGTHYYPEALHLVYDWAVTMGHGRWTPLSP